MLGAFGVIAISLVCLQLIEFLEASQIQDAIELIQKNALVSVRLVDRAAMDVEREQVLVGEHIFEQDAPTMHSIERTLAAVRKDYADSARAYSPLTTFSGEAYAWHLFTSAVASARAHEDAVVALSRENRDVDAAKSMAAIKPLFDEIDRKATDLVDINQQGADAAADDAHARQRFNWLVQRVATAGILVIVLIAGMWLTRAVIRALHAIEGLNEELENRNRELDAFASRIAHDLRNPLNAINLASELLADSASDATTIGAMIQRGVARVSQLIDDLLMLSRVGLTPRSTARTEPVASALREDLGHLVAEAHGVLRLNLEPADLRCTENLLRQMLWNLGENAVKYRRAGVVAELDIVGRPEAERYVITVTDNGLGMSSDDTRHAFEPFFRSSKTSSSIAGTGLGLAIVRRIVEASEGRISIDSKLGEGTTFVVTLELADRAGPS